jgi:RNA polymerase sigma-70 factor (ECF subfamily)
MGSVSATDISASVEAALESHRRELTGYCYRMLGSGSEAEDAVQETMIRAWRAADRLDAREALRAWLYRIAHNVCLDMLKGAQRRARPMDLGPSSTAATTLGPPLVEQSWVLPIQDSRVLPTDGDPAELASAKETIKLAFVAALQLLPPKQRAVLILREVLRWQASEVAELLGTSVASVNSALQRARATIEASDLDASTTPSEVDGKEERDLLARYVDAFESYDVSAFVALLSEDAQFSMPPYDLWLRGPEQVGHWLLGQGFGCKGSRLVPIQANGSPAFAQYKPSDEPGVRKPWAIVVLDTDGERVTQICSFLGEERFRAFGLPLELRD